MLTREILLEKYKSHILPGPLNGIIVVGFCYYVAGPMALQNLVSQGALVIKIEGKPIGDPSRYVFSKSLFNSMSHNQLSVVLDYKNSDDCSLLTRLLQLADIIVDNRSIKAKKHDLILQNHLNDSNKVHSQVYCSIDGFPKAEVNTDPALDASVQAITGLPYTNCFSPNKPLKIGIPVLDQVSGLLAAHYVTANLYLLLKFPDLPESAKKLIYISVSMAGVAMWLQTGQIIQTLEGKEFLRNGNQDQFAAPFSYYMTENGLISVATVNENQFKRFCMMVLQNESFHKKYPTIQIRLKDQDQFEADLNELLKSKPREYWVEQCKKYDIPAAAVLKVSEAIKQPFVQSLIGQSTNGRPIISHGVEHSFFVSQKKPVPAPFLNQDYTLLSKLHRETDSYKEEPTMQAKL